MKPILRADELRALLDYCAETGALTWLVSRARGARAGDIAGTPRPNGYVALKINGRAYLAHRLAWLWVYGDWPVNDIDHINGIRDDNRLINLRQATRSENLQNKAIQSNNRLRVKGVDLFNGRYRAKIKYGSKHYHLGMYDSIEDAAAAYELAAQQNFGEFALHVSRKTA